MLVAIHSENEAFNVLLCLDGVLKSFMTFGLQMAILSEKSILVLHGAETASSILLQQVVQVGCKVFTTVNDIDEEQALQKFKNGILHYYNTPFLECFFF